MGKRKTLLGAVGPWGGYGSREVLVRAMAIATKANPVTRTDMLALGLITPNEALHDMAVDGVIAPTWAHPAFASDTGLRLPDEDRAAADRNVAETIHLDYADYPCSQAAWHCCARVQREAANG